MRAVSLKERIRRYFSNHQGVWIHKEEIAELSKGAGYSHENAYRRLRELSSEGMLKSEEKKNPNTGLKTVWYLY